MKYLLYLSFCILLLLSCSTKKEKENFSGTINLTSGSGDSVYVGLYYYDSYNRNSNWDWLSDPKYFSAFVGNEFSFNVEPGRYTLVAFAYGYEVVKKRLFIPDKKTVLTTNISLVPLGIESEIKEVKLIGEFCKWNSGKALSMNQENGKWVVNSKLPMEVDGKYQFLVDGVPRNDLSNKNYFLRKDIADFVNVYKGDSIEFDPTIYAKTIEKSSADIHGFDLLEQYDQFSEELRDTVKSISSILISIRRSEAEEWEQKYNRVIKAIEPIGKKYDPSLSQLLIEWRLHRLAFLHPMMYEYRQVWQSGKIDSVKFKELIQGQKFHNFLTTQLNLLKALEPTSYLLEGDFQGIAVFLDFILKNNPQLKKEYNLGDDYFYNFIIDFVKKSPKKTLCTHVLYHSAYDYVNGNEPDKVTFLINWLKKDYADEFYVGKGHADKILASLNIIEGKVAPDFEVTTLEGKVFKLSDFQGKFVFIDFWGTWCTPCRRELPNNIKLAQSISKDKLKIIGLAQDDDQELKEYLKNNPLPYENAIAPEKVLKAYGITAYPTTFLINPKGKILAKNLGGNQLIEDVRAKIENFR